MGSAAGLILLWMRSWFLSAQRSLSKQAYRQRQACGQSNSWSTGIILAEVDGTFLRAHRDDTDKFEVRLGLVTTGKALESPTAKHPRFRLLERVRYGGVETVQDFGERLFHKGEAHLALSRVQHLLIVGDSADWVEALTGHDRWRATYQLDWWHLAHAFHHTFPGHPKLINRLQRHLYRVEGDMILSAVRLAKINEIGEPERVQPLLCYLEANQADSLAPAPSAPIFPLKPA